MATATRSSLVSTQPRLSNDDRITSLLSAAVYRKAGKGVALTFSFPDAQSPWSAADYAESGEPDDPDYRGLSAAEQANAVGIFAEWARVATITLSRVADNPNVVGDIRVAYTDVNTDPEDDGSTLAYAYLPGGDPFASDIWLGHDAFSAGEELAPGTLSGNTLLHEIGHALGLKHPFDIEEDDFGFLFNDVTLPSTEDSADNDSLFSTVLGYDAFPGFEFSEASFYPTTPMPVDILAIQYLYGINTATGKGNTTYTFNDSTEYFQTIWDASGKDTISYAGATADGLIDLNAGGRSELGQRITFTDADGRPIDAGRSGFFTGTVAIAYNCLIENAIGGEGDDNLIGNQLPNQLTGGGGDDILLAAAGADTCIGGAGADTYLFEPGDLSANAKRSDVILDFTRGEDRIDLSLIGVGILEGLARRGLVDASEVEALADGLMRFSETAPTSTDDATGLVWFSRGVVFISTDADRAAENVITLTGVTALSADDLILARPV